MFQWQVGMIQSQNDWRTPIEFYGKVVDEKTNPIANAEIHFVWTDLSIKGNSDKQTTSDTNGLFTLTKVSGKNLIVQASKEGYDAYNPSGAGFNYAGDNQNFIPNSSAPIVFKLRKKGVADPLIVVRGSMRWGKTFAIPKDGTPTEISLMTGKVVSATQGDLRVECRTNDTDKKPDGKYNWNCRLTVPGGGLVESTNSFDFEAPLEDYQTSESISMSASDQAGWSSRIEKKYFLKLANGNYARITFAMFTEGDHFFKIESYLNPSSSRNLEFDPKKMIQPSE